MAISASFSPKDIFPVTEAVASKKAWQRFEAACDDQFKIEDCIALIEQFAENRHFPAFAGDLAKLEETLFNLQSNVDSFLPIPTSLVVNPTVTIIETAWRSLPSFITAKKKKGLRNRKSQKGKELILIWLDPVSSKAMIRKASSNDLLALKIVMEELDPEDVSKETGETLGSIDRWIDSAVEQGLLFRPGSQVRRPAMWMERLGDKEERFLTSSVFTLQWHLTQACDLSCKHCYDRSNRSAMPTENALRVIEEFRKFCRQKYAYGQISFTGGNPLLHPDFFAVYQKAADLGFMTAILGNPASEGEIEKICQIQKPEFYQVSLEGLHTHNDAIRGSGHYERVMAFLDILKKNEIYSMVMLTLTQDNVDQVIPLGKILQGSADLFTFNRISLVGEGVNLFPPPTESYKDFLEQYNEAASAHSVFAFKDNFFNILRHEKGQQFFGGCAGYGCGAAFNFVSLLPEGEVYACRKFHSPIGNINEQSFAEIYDSPKARMYRAGSSSCQDCSIRPVCGGCLAVTQSHGLDITKDLDPYCFINN